MRKSPWLTVLLPVAKAVLVALLTLLGDVSLDGLPSDVVRAALGAPLPGPRPSESSSSSLLLLPLHGPVIRLVSAR